jgi:hypothetical protein
LHPTQALQGLNHRLQSPGCDLLLKFLIQSQEAFGGLSKRAEVFLEDELLSGGGTDDFGAPAPMSGAPRGVACRAEIVSEHKGFETELGGLEIAAGSFARPAEGAAGVIFPRGDIDGGQLTRAPQAGQLDGVTRVSLDAIAGLLGKQGRGDDPADVASCGKITREPGATRPRFLDKDQVWGLGWPLSNAWITSGLPGADGAEADDLGIVVVGDVGHGHRVLMDLQSEGKRARWVQG